MAGLASLLLLAAAPQGAATNTGPDQPQRVLVPAVAPRIQAAFARAAPTWRLDGARIAQDRVQARVCADDVCHDLVLGDGKACTTAAVGPWCARWQGAEPAAADVVYRALEADGDADIWHVIAARPPQPPIVAAPPPARLPPPPGTVLPVRGPEAGPADDVAAPATAAVALGSGVAGPDGAAVVAADAEASSARMLVVALLVAAAAFMALVRLRKPAADGEVPP